MVRIVGLDIQENNNDMRIAILKAIAESLNARIPQAIPKIQERVSQILVGPFKKSSVYNAIVNGPLDGHFGIIKGQAQSRIDGIIDIFASQVKVEYVPLRATSSGFNNGGVNIYAIEDDFLKVKDSDLGVTINKNPANRPFAGMRLPWLQWLLFEGGKVIIQDYKLVEGVFTRRHSRSGKAKMLPEEGSYWAVPTQFIGTKEANFVTEAIKNSEKWLETEFVKILKSEIEKVL